MTSLYLWLKFAHLVGLGLFLFGHGISGGASFALHARPAAAVSRSLLQLSTWSYRIAYPGLLLLVATGIWMGFLGGLWGRAWIWASIGVLVIASGLMTYLSMPFHRARDAGQAEPQINENMARTRPAAIAWIGTLALLVILFMMVFKPF